MQSKPKNPYILTNPINDPKMFFGPYAVLRVLYSIVVSNQSVSLVGSRHSGKSTILRFLCLPAMQAYFEEYDFSRHLFIYIDVRNCLRKTSDGFLDFMYEEIIAASRGRLALFSSKLNEDRFMDILRQVKEQGMHTVMVLDVFDDIARSRAFDPEFFMFLRAQASAGFVSYVTASIRPLDQISHEEIQGSPFFNIFSPSHIKPLTLEEARNLIMIPSQRAGYPFSEEECAWVLNLAGRHPFFIMSVCNALFKFRETSSQPTAELDRKVLEDEIYSMLSSHFEYLWKDLNNQEQMSIIAKTQQLGIDLADKKPPDFIESSLFCRFIRKEHVFLDTIEDELKGVLKHLDSPPFLADSKLKYLKVVTRRIEQRGVTSNFEKGLIILGILTEAFEQLQGEGKREDFAQSWKEHNILFYTYFANNGALNQAGIAHRLAMSLRQYHREKDEAIKILTNRILKMEATCRQEDIE